MERCFDCFAELGDSERFAVLKERALTPEEAATDDPLVLGLLKWSQEFVCPACAGWYRDAIELTADEAGA